MRIEDTIKRIMDIEDQMRELQYELKRRKWDYYESLATLDISLAEAVKLNFVKPLWAEPRRLTKLRK